MSLRAVSPLAENHCSINSLHCSFLKDRACFLILFYPSSPRTCVSHSIYPYFYSIALIEAFCVPDHILVTADTAVKTWSRSLSARCLRCSSSNAVCGGYQNSVSDFSSLCFTMVKATQTLKWIHHLCTAIYRSALGTLKCFVPTADIKICSHMFSLLLFLHVRALFPGEQRWVPFPERDVMSGWGLATMTLVGGGGKELTGSVCPGSLVPAVGMFLQHILRCKARGPATSCAQALFDACSTRNFLCFKNSRTSD